MKTNRAATGKCLELSNSRPTVLPPGQGPWKLPRNIDLAIGSGRSPWRGWLTLLWTALIALGGSRVADGVVETNGYGARLEWHISGIPDAAVSCISTQDPSPCYQVLRKNYRNATPITNRSSITFSASYTAYVGSDGEGCGDNTDVLVVEAAVTLSDQQEIVVPILSPIVDFYAGSQYSNTVSINLGISENGKSISRIDIRAFEKNSRDFGSSLCDGWKKQDLPAQAFDCTWTYGGISASMIGTPLFELVSTSPSNRENNVFWDRPDLRMNFSANVATQSVSTATVQVAYQQKDQRTIPGQYQVSSNVIVFRPDSALDDYGREIGLTIKSGSNGVLSVSGAQLEADTLTAFYTMPTVTVQVIPAQVVDGVDWVQDKESVVRVKAIWGGGNERLPGSDLLVITGATEVAYDGAETVSKGPQAFYRLDDARAMSPKYKFTPKEAGLAGNSANYFSVDGQVPITGTLGAHTILGRVILRDHLGVDHVFESSTNIGVRSFKTPWTSSYKGYRLFYVPLALGGWTTGETRDINALAQSSSDFFKKIFPVANVKWRAAPKVWFVGPQPPILKSKWVAGISVSLSRYSYFTRDVIFGVIPGDLMRLITDAEAQAGGIASASVSSVLLSDDAKEPIAAHEIGHLVYYHNLFDIFGWYAHPEEPFVLKGFNMEKRQIVDGEILKGEYLSDLMVKGVADYLDTGPKVWISKPTYQHFLDEMTSAGGWFAKEPRAGGTNVCLVDGVISSIGGSVTGQVDAVLLLDNAPVSTNDPNGTYRVELQDVGGAVLQSCRFTPVLRPDIDGELYAYFRVLLPMSSAVRWAVLKKEAGVLARLPRSLAAPVVSLVEPAAGVVITNMLVTRWTATDADSGSLSASLFFSSDAGTNWSPLAVNLSTTRYECGVASLEASTACRVKVMVSDGFNTTPVTSGVFTVRRSPGVSWVFPTAGATRVSSSSSIRAGFGDAMSSASLTTNSLYLRESNGQKVTARVSYDADGWTAILVPAAPLSLGQIYTGVVAATVANLSGTALGTEYKWRFTIEDGTLPPDVEWIAPTNAISCLQNVNTPLSAAATGDTGRVISKVEFYDGGTKLGEDLSAPYTYLFASAVTGLHVVTAHGLDHLGNRGVSPELLITVASNQPEEVIFDNFNKGGVSSGPTQPTQFAINRAYTITYMETYHWFNGGALPGTLGLQRSGGALYGPWAATGAPAGAVSNAYWVVTPNTVIPAGTYQVIDSGPSTWSHNAQSGYRGFCRVLGIPVGEALAVQEDANFGVVSNHFGFNINWISGQVVVVDASTNLTRTNWIPMATSTLAGAPCYFSDPKWTNYMSRFYRLRSP